MRDTRWEGRVREFTWISGFQVSKADTVLLCNALCDGRNLALWQYEEEDKRKKWGRNM